MFFLKSCEICNNNLFLKLLQAIAFDFSSQALCPQIITKTSINFNWGKIVDLISDFENVFICLDIFEIYNPKQVVEILKISQGHICDGVPS